jgi:hypothetical protein
MPAAAGYLVQDGTPDESGKRFKEKRVNFVSTVERRLRLPSGKRGRKGLRSRLVTWQVRDWNGLVEGKDRKTWSWEPRLHGRSRLLVYLSAC